MTLYSNPDDDGVDPFDTGSFQSQPSPDKKTAEPKSTPAPSPPDEGDDPGDAGNSQSQPGAGFQSRPSVFDPTPTPTETKPPPKRKPKPRPTRRDPPDEGDDAGNSQSRPGAGFQSRPTVFEPTPTPGQVVPPISTLPLNGVDTSESTDNDGGDSSGDTIGAKAPTQDGRSEFRRPKFVGDADDRAEVERELEVKRRIALRRFLRGERPAPHNRRWVREALGISNDEASHLGLSDYSPDTNMDAETWARGFEMINAERRAQYDLDKAEYDRAKARYEKYLVDKAAYDEYMARDPAQNGPAAPPDDGVDLFNPREWENRPAAVTAPVHEPKPEVFSTIVGEEQFGTVEAIDEGTDTGWRWKQPEPTPESEYGIVGEEQFGTVEAIDEGADTDWRLKQPEPTPESEYGEEDPGGRFTVQDAIAAPYEDGEHNYFQPPSRVVAVEDTPSENKYGEVEDTGGQVGGERFSYITHDPLAENKYGEVEDTGGQVGGERFTYSQTPSGLTVAQTRIQEGDYLLDEGETKKFYPHPTPGQTGDALLFESDGARSVIVEANPADYLLEESPQEKREAPPAMGGGDYLLSESDGRRLPLADVTPPWFPRARGDYFGHDERRGKGQSHGSGDGGVLDAITGGAAWMQGQWDRRIVDPIRDRWPAEDSPRNPHTLLSAGQMAQWSPGYDMGLESVIMVMTPEERRDFATDVMREVPVMSGLAAADESEGWEKALHLGGALIEMPWLYGAGRGAGFAMRGAGRVAKQTPQYLPVYGVGVGGVGVARPVKATSGTVDDFLASFGRREPAPDLTPLFEDINRGLLGLEQCMH